MPDVLKKVTASLVLLVLAGCAVFDGHNKVIGASPSFITLQISHANLDESVKWAESVAKQHCMLNSKKPFILPYIDNSWHKEHTYYCINNNDEQRLVQQLNNLSFDNFWIYMRNTYGGVPTSIQRFGTAVTPLSNMANTPQPATSSPRQATQIPCIKTGERIDGFFKICQYSCGGTPVTATVRSHEICQPQRSF